MRLKIYLHIYENSKTFDTPKGYGYACLTQAKCTGIVQFYNKLESRHFGCLYVYVKTKNINIQTNKQTNQCYPLET